MINIETKKYDYIENKSILEWMKEWMSLIDIQENCPELAYNTIKFNANYRDENKEHKD